MKTYECFLEIAGPTAMFTRPDSGSAAISYPVPTYSAAKGIFESILRLKYAEISPTKVEVCTPLVFHNYTTNYGGPLRKSGQLKDGNSYQLFATVLVNVCYRIYAEPRPMQDSPGGINQAHAYQDMFFRRLHRGECRYVPCLGWKEFVPSYVGTFRAEVSPLIDLNLEIPSLLKSVWDKPSNGKKAPAYHGKPMRIVKGCLNYAQ